MFNLLMIICLIVALYNAYRFYAARGFNAASSSVLAIMFGSIFAAYVIIIGFVDAFGTLFGNVRAVLKMLGL